MSEQRPSQHEDTKPSEETSETRDYESSHPQFRVQSFRGGRLMGQKKPSQISDPALSGPRVHRVREQAHIAKEKLRGKLAEAEADLEELSLKSQEEAGDTRRVREVRAREDYQHKSLESQAGDLEHKISRLGEGVTRHAEAAKEQGADTQRQIEQQQPQQQQQQQQVEALPAAETEIPKESTPSIEADRGEPGKSKPADLGRTLREAVDKAKSDAQRYVDEFEEIAEQSKEAFGQFLTGYHSKDAEGESSSSSRRDRGEEVGMPAGTGPMEIKTSPSGDVKRKSGIKDKVFHALGLQPGEDVQKEYDTRSIDKAVARPPR